MAETYTAYHFKVMPLQPMTDILIAQLSELSFESFVEQEDGFSAYIQKNDWKPSIAEAIKVLIQGKEAQITFTVEDIAPVNWNETWEKNFNPITVDNLVSIKAPFHDVDALKYNIVIEPKMSFGTGHHETTHLMIRQLLALKDFTHKAVLDMGTGTGVLAILSEMMGAKTVDAVDIDDWSYDNALENIKRNNCHNISVYKGDASWFESQMYDLILANINRNVLLNDLSQYVKHLKPSGMLILSGFYDNDLSLIEKEAVLSGLILNTDAVFTRHDWACAKFEKL